MTAHLRHVIATVALLTTGSVNAAAPPTASLLDAMADLPVGGFARAATPYVFAFPRDHGAHPQYASEWWYYAGNVESADGRRFGYDLTLFRRGLAPMLPARPSAWAATDVYMGHLTVSDEAGGRFHAFERVSRDGAGLAGSAIQPVRVWIEDWSMDWEADEIVLRAAHGDVGVDLRLSADRPPVPTVAARGSRWFPLGADGTHDAGNHHHAFTSFPRLPTRGTVVVGGRPAAVQGDTWMEHQFSSLYPDSDLIGWDWFGLQLEDGRDLSWGRMRRRGGEPGWEFIQLIHSDGRSEYVDPATARIETLGHWRSGVSGATYPSGWRLALPSAGLDLRVTPRLRDQELPLSVVYWEGAVTVDGTSAGRALSGRGYAELTGYAGGRLAFAVR